MPRRRSPVPMETEELSQLIEIVVDLPKASESLPPEEKQAYDEAKRSVVEARHQAAAHDGDIRIL